MGYIAGISGMDCQPSIYRVSSETSRDIPVIFGF